MRALILALALLGSCSHAVAAAPKCPSTLANDQWSADCFETVEAKRRVKPQYRKNIVPNKFGRAVIVVAEPFEVLAVDRAGLVVVPGIYAGGDFDYPRAEAHIGRFRADGKCGYFRTDSLKVIVPTAYDECKAFHEGTALACLDCVRYCRSGECEDSTLVGGQGFVFDIKGRLQRQFSLPKLEEVCGRVGVEEVSKVDGRIPFLKCKPEPGLEL
jgi:hypothetical protein